MNITTYTHQGFSLFIWFLLVVLQKQTTSANTLVFVVVVDLFGIGMGVLLSFVFHLDWV